MPGYLSALAFLATAAIAQTAAAPQPNGSISGAVADALTGAPILGLTVSLDITRPPGIGVARFGGNSGPAGTFTKTDGQGRYQFSDLKPGNYAIAVYRETLTLASMTVKLGPGQDLTTADFPVEVPCSISGTVTDSDKQPAAGQWVLLIQKAYLGGKTLYGQVAGTVTDAQGRYKLDRSVKPETPYAILAMPMLGEIPAISTAPEDLQKRKPAPAPTYYPDAGSIEASQSITLRSGQDLDEVNIRMAQSKSYCAEGITEAEGVPAALDFEIAESQPANGPAGGLSGGFMHNPPHGTTGRDGRFRLCDLHPGEYILRAGSRLGLYAAAPVVIENRDVAGLRVNALPGVRIFGEVMWDGDPPAQAPNATLGIVMSPASDNRSLVQASSSLPGRFTVEDLGVEEYSVRVSGAPSGYYVKDVIYGGIGILHWTFTPGSAVGDAGMRVVVAGDAGTLSAKVTDNGGKPVQSASVCFLPVHAGTPAELETAIVCAKTGVTGMASSGALAPGKYRVVAATVPVDHSAASIDRLWGARFNGQEVDLAPNGVVQVSLQPVPLY